MSGYKFTDQELDNETNLYNYDARLYDPVIGRFGTTDSVMQNAYDPQSLNAYSYCQNNPLIYTDPTGHVAEDGGSDSKKWKKDKYKAEIFEQVYDRYNETNPVCRFGPEIKVVDINGNKTQFVADDIINDARIQFRLELSYLWDKKGVNIAQLSTEALDTIYLEAKEQGIAQFVTIVTMASTRYSLKGVKNETFERTYPENLSEQITIKEVKAGAGGQIMKGEIKDPRFSENIWKKMQHVHEPLGGGKKSVVHFWQRIADGFRTGFKFKD
jgi:RHS repeat-associated protein